MEGGGGVQMSTADPPMRASEQTVWADVSSLIDAACEDLQDGELIHGENFSLFAAMSALEIMDPKMDSGMQRSGYHSVEEAIENGAAPIPLSTDPNVDVQRTIDFMDHLLACEATWHRGHLLAQTVYSCIYLLQIERTSSHALLHSYCRIIRATCNSVISAVSSARTHEEEDIFTTTYGLPLKGDGDEKCLSIVNSVEEAISCQLRACKASSSKKKLNGGLESLHENVDLNEGYCKSILARLRFRKDLWTGMRIDLGFLWTCVESFSCELCQLGKHHRTTYKRSHLTFSRSLFDLVYCDVWVHLGLCLCLVVVIMQSLLIFYVCFGYIYSKIVDLLLMC